MRTVNKDYGMAHICLWDRNTLEYDGCCPHCCLTEQSHGDFELSAEQLEAQAAHKTEKRTTLRAATNSDYHFKQMETNRDEYLARNAIKTAKLRAKNAEKFRKQQRDNAAKHLANSTYYCELCKLSFPKKSELKKHNATCMHLQKADDLANKPHKYLACNVAFDQVGMLNRHFKSARHKKMANLSSSQLG
jgi:Zinc-finger of C2H2 type